MVRVNLIKPRCLTDQHLRAEYLEIIMLVSYVRKYKGLEDVPRFYSLGKGHIKFFKDKLGYLSKRHEALRKEMIHRGFKALHRLDLKGFSSRHLGDWRPSIKDKALIKRRLIARVQEKFSYYRYCREKRSLRFYVDLIRKG